MSYVNLGNVWSCNRSNVGKCKCDSKNKSEYHCTNSSMLPVIYENVEYNNNCNTVVLCPNKGVSLESSDCIHGKALKIDNGCYLMTNKVSEPLGPSCNFISKSDKGEERFWVNKDYCVYNSSGDITTNASNYKIQNAFSHFDKNIRNVGYITIGPKN